MTVNFPPSRPNPKILQRWLCNVLLMLTFVVSRGQVIHVDPAATGAGDGASWGNAQTDLQSAIDFAATFATQFNPAQIWVKAGTYQPTNTTDRSIAFELKNNVYLYGGFNGTETQLSQRDPANNITILSGDIGILGDSTDNSYGLVFASSGIVHTTVVEGFHLQDVSTINETSSPAAVTYGAVGVQGSPNEVIINNCWIHDNEAVFGSAISTILASSVGKLSVRNSRIYNNRLAAIWATQTFEMVNVLTYDNATALLRQAGNTTIINSTFHNNTTGVTFQNQASNPTGQVYNCIFSQTPLNVDLAAQPFIAFGTNLVDNSFTLGQPVYGDPQFFDTQFGDFRIKHCSPAVDAGINGHVPGFITEDLPGNPRVTNGTVDLGAVENVIAPLSYQSVTTSDILCPGDGSGQINVTGGGGSGAPLTYSIDGTNFQSSGLFTGLNGGTYDVSIRDTGNDCVVTAPYTINEPPPINFTISADTLPANSAIRVQAQGGSGPYQYSLDGISFVSGDLPLTTGPVTVFVRDASNCIVSQDFYLAPNGRFVLFVDPDATGDGSGARWSNAFIDLQTALDAATQLAGALSETEVWVKEGIYYPDIQSSTDRNARIELRNRVYLMGGFDGTETLLSQRDINNNETILSGDIGVANDSTDNSFGLMTVRDDVTDQTVIDGWTLQGAFALSTASGNGAIAMIGDVGDLFVRNCTFLFNLSNEGACIAMREVSNTTAQLHVEYSFFAINGFETTSGYVGSAIHVKNEATIFNSFFIENKSGVGGVFYLNPAGANLTITNSTLYSNRTGNSGSVLFDASSGTSTLTLQNSIVWDNFGPLPIFMALPSALTANNNIYQGALNGNNNISANPQFFDAGAFDLRIKHCSPAVDAGDNSFVPSGAVEDLSGDPRVVNVVDIGAYENQVTPIFLSASEIGAISCNGGADGSISINAGGGSGSPLEYSLDGTTYGASGLFPNLSAGAYTVFIRDTGDACVSTEELVVTEPDALSLSTAVTNVECHGDLTGSISGTVSGGSTPYQVSFDGGTSFQTGQFTSQFDIPGLGMGNYDLTVVDGNGCTLLPSGTTTITEPAVLSGTLTPIDVSCHGADDGSISTTPTGGTAPYQFSLDATNFQSQPTFESLAPGAYNVTIQDTNLCTTTLSTTITEPTALSLSSDSLADVKCFMGADGFISVAASGGTAPYVFSNAGGAFQSTSQWTDLEAGSYAIAVRDAQGCEATINMQVDEPDALTAILTATDPSSCTVADGQLTVAASGGTGPYTYQLDSSSPGGTNVFNGLDDGSYQVTVIDANNCTWSGTIDLEDPVSSMVTIVPAEVSCFGGDNGSLTLNVTGGSTPITYSLDGGAAQPANVFDGLSAGQYTVDVLEGNGCRQSVQTNIGSPDSLSFTSLITAVNCAGDNTGQIVVEAMGGTAPLTYSADGDTFVSSETLAGLGAGQYNVVVQDANNCQASQTVTIAEPEALTLALDSIAHVSCFGAADGFVLASASGGSGMVAYRLEGNALQSSGQFDRLGPGTYSIAVSDENQCSVQVDAVVTSPDSLQATAALDGNRLTLSTSGGTAPYSYQLNDGDVQTENVFENIGAGEYRIEVTDANGCRLSLTEQMVVLSIQPASPTVVYPNPARDEIRILTKDLQASAALWDLEGRLVASDEVINGQRRIQTTGIPAGIYHVHLITRDRREIIKVRITQ